MLSWNFIPLRSHGSGFLEIIRWCFRDSADSGFRRCSRVDSFRLVSDTSSDCKKGSKAHSFIHGALGSISPVSVVPCMIGSCTSRSYLWTKNSNAINIRGFLAQILVCECKQCSSKELLKALLHGWSEAQYIHSFARPLFVYFSGPASSWHPVLSKMIGNVVSLSGLKKKLVYIGKEESRLMYVTTTGKALLHLPSIPKRWVPFKSTSIRRGGELVNYTGVVTGIYMKGMVVELDNKVPLLVTDQPLTLPHSLRVGALISVTNAHFVHSNFYWTKMLLLGACFQTSISIESFSPLKYGCHVVSQSQSLLGTFINTLTFPARLWALHVVSSFRRKFAGILSKKEILGTKHKEGLAQNYATSRLPPSVSQSRQGVFLEFSKHEFSGCWTESNCGQLKLVMPISDFVSHCEATWMNMLLKSESGCGIIGAKSQLRSQTCEGISSYRSIRRILRPESLGVSLLGYLKISPSSKQLQLTDASGAVDAVVPDLPSTLDSNTIYEVNDYSVIIEGALKGMGTSELHRYGPISCRSIFDGVPSVKDTNFTIYIHFHLKKATCKNLPFYPFFHQKENTDELESGLFHLLQITHKYPLVQKFEGLSSDRVISNQSSMFVEAIILPWDLSLAQGDGDSHSTKRCKVDSQPSKPLILTISDSLTGSGDLCGHLRGCSCPPVEIPCLAIIRGVEVDGIVRPGILYCKIATSKVGCASKPNPSKVLLEFKYESLLMYHMLQIGGYYLTKHMEQDLFCNLEGSDFGCSKVLITSKTHLWTLSFRSDEPSYHPFHDSSISNDMDLSGSSNQDELPFQISIDEHPKTVFDIQLQVSPDVLKFVRCFIELNEGPINASEQTSANVSDSLLPEGNLITLRGDVVAVCDNGGSLCIHVMKDHRLVKICDGESKHAYPIGFGPGVNATFYRILVLGGHKLVMMPVSFVAINAIWEVIDHNSKECSVPMANSEKYYISSREDVPSSLIANIADYIECKPIKIRCRVLAVYILVLEKKHGNIGSGKSTDYLRTCAFDIPLAAFVLDDGSSSCCCWANAQSASNFLRLNEKVPQKRCGSSARIRKDGACNTTNYHLDKLLEKLGNITVKNCGSLFDSSYQDLTVCIGSDNNALCSADENLLKLIILNACCTSVLSVVGSLMDANTVGQLEKQLLEMDMALHSMPNIWATDVQHIDYLTEARSTIQQLINQ